MSEHRRIRLTPLHAVACALIIAAMLAGCGNDDSAKKSGDSRATALKDVAAGTIAFRRYLDAEQTHAALFTLSSHGEDEKQITKPPEHVVDAYPEWSPNGKSIAFDREPPDSPFEIHVVGADGSDEHLVDPGCPPRISSKEICDESQPAWSPDGTMLHFGWAAGALRQVNGEETIEVAGIGVAKPDGSGAKLLTQTKDRPGTAEDNGAIRSTDGRQLGFIRLNISAKPLGGRALFVSNADGTDAKRITPWELRADNPAWSPDGTLISFRAEPSPDQEFVGDLYSVRPDGSDLKKLTKNKDEQVFASSFSPDSAWIVFAMTGIGELPDLFVMRADGSDLTPLTRTKAWESTPDWSPR